MPESSAKREVPAEWNELTKRIIGCAMEVHSIIGPGLVERLYEDALVYELGLVGLRVERQVPFRLVYKGLALSEQRLDLVIEGLVVVELKSVERVHDAHLAQLVSYLRSANFPLGLLINFHGLHLKDNIHRRINPKAIPARHLMAWDAAQSHPPSLSLRPSDPSASSAYS